MRGACGNCAQVAASETMRNLGKRAGVAHNSVRGLPREGEAATRVKGGRIGDAGIFRMRRVRNVREGRPKGEVRYNERCAFA